MYHNIRKFLVVICSVLLLISSGVVKVYAEEDNNVEVETVETIDTTETTQEEKLFIYDLLDNDKQEQIIQEINLLRTENGINELLFNDELEESDINKLLEDYDADSMSLEEYVESKSQQLPDAYYLHIKSSSEELSAFLDYLVEETDLLNEDYESASFVSSEKDDYVLTLIKYELTEKEEPEIVEETIIENQDIDDEIIIEDDNKDQNTEEIDNVDNPKDQEVIEDEIEQLPSENDINSISTNLESWHKKIYVGEQYTISDFDSSRDYYAEDRSIVSISSDGVVTGLKHGKTDVRFYSTGHEYHTVSEIEVLDIPDPEFIPIDSFSLSFEGNPSFGVVGDTMQICINTTPRNATKEGFEYTSLNDVASVDENGLITFLKQGKTNILVSNRYYPYSLVLYIPVHVIDITPIESIKLYYEKDNKLFEYYDEYRNNIPLKVNEENNLIVRYFPSTANNTELYIEPYQEKYNFEIEYGTYYFDDTNQNENVAFISFTPITESIGNVYIYYNKNIPNYSDRIRYSYFTTGHSNEYAKATIKANGGTFENIYGDELELYLSVVDYGSIILPKVTKAGSAFKQWTSNYSNIYEEYGRYNLYVSSQGDEIVAEWSDDYHTITFDASGGVFNDGSKIQSITYPYNSRKSFNITPTRDGYQFGGWYLNKAGLGEPYTVDYYDYDFTLYAKWIKEYALICDANGGYFNNYYNGEQYKIDKEVYQKPADKMYSQWYSINSPLHDDGYVFVGWYLDKDCTISFDERSYPVGDLTIYAKYAPGDYTITFDAGDGYVYGKRKAIFAVESGETCLSGLPIDITNNNILTEPEGKIFYNWSTSAYYDSDFVDLNEVLNEPVNENRTYYAKYKNSHTLTFNANGGTIEYCGHEYDVLRLENVMHGETLNEYFARNNIDTEGLTAKYDNYDFLGWSWGPNEQLYSNVFNEPINWNNTYYASYDGFVSISDVSFYMSYVLSYFEGDEFTLVPSIRPENATNKNLVYVSSNPNVLAVDNQGNAICLSEGFATVTAYSENRKSSSYTARVINNDDKGSPVSGFIYSGDNVKYINIGDSLQLEALAYPSYANQELVWRSDDENIVTVDENGLITGINEGSSYVRAFSRYYNKSTLFSVIVSEQDHVKLRSVSINPTYFGDYVLKPNEPIEFMVRFNPVTAYDKIFDVSCDIDMEEVNLIKRYEKIINEDGEEETVGYFKFYSSHEGNYKISTYYGEERKNSYQTINITVADDSVKLRYHLNGGKYLNYDDVYTMGYLRGGNVQNFIYPTKENKSFNGWYFDLNDENTKFYPQYSSTYTINEDIDVYAKWDDTVNVSFDANGGTFYNGDTVSTVQVAKGQVYYSSKNMPWPTREGYSLLGFCYDQECTHMAVSAVYYNSADIQEDVTLYAKWKKSYSIIYNAMEGTIYDEKRYVANYGTNYNYVSELYATPVCKNKTFVGWYRDKALSRKADDLINKVLTENVEVYAKYTEDTYAISFNALEGSAYLSYDNNGQIVTKLIGKGSTIGTTNITITPPNNKLFSGKWYLDQDFTQEVDLLTYIPNSDITLYAKYDNKYDVEFNLNGGYFLLGNQRYNTYSSSVREGNQAYFPYILKHDDNYVFDGWYSDSQFVNKINLDTYVPSENVTLYAKWNATSYTLTLDANGRSFEEGNLTTTYDVAIGSTIKSIRELYVFPTYDGEKLYITGWSLDGSDNEVSNDYMINSNTTLYAIWQKEIAVTSVSISNPIDSIVYGETYTFKAEVLPEDALNKNVEWSISDTSLATINDKGLFTPLRSGTVEVIVTTEDGSYTDTCEIVIEDPTIRVESITLNEKSLDMLIGETTRLKANILPEDATDKSITWASADINIASVDIYGNVKALSEGVVLITAKSSDGLVKATCALTITDPYVRVTGIALDKKEITININEFSSLSATVLPNNASDKTFVYSSLNPEVATVDKYGYVDGISVGTTVILAIPNDNPNPANFIVDYCIVHVIDDKIPVTDVAINKAIVNMIVGDTDVLTATVFPEDATNKAITWSSSNDDIVTINQEGQITAVGVGSATITVTTVDGKFTDECEITVEELNIPMESIELDKDSLVMNVDDEYDLIATILPENTTETNVTWSSSDEDVVTVNQEGHVLAVGVGSATITVVNDNGLIIAVCSVTVEPIEDSVIELSINKEEATININSGINLDVTVTEDGQEVQRTLNWKSSDSTIATVDNQGNVLGLKPGTIIISAYLDGVNIEELLNNINNATLEYNQANTTRQQKESILEEKQSALTAAENNYKEAQNNTKQALDTLNEIEDSIKTTTATKNSALTELNSAMSELAEAQANLQNIRDNASTSGNSLTNALQEKERIEQELAEAKAQYDKGSLGFFESRNSTKAIEIINFASNVENAAKGNGNAAGVTVVGGVGDATSLENTKAIFNYIRQGNAIRVEDAYRNQSKYASNSYKTSDGLPNELLVSDDAIAAAQVDANMSAVTGNHWKDGRYLMIRGYGENLAPSWPRGWDPYYGWYTHEKVYYEKERTANGLPILNDNTASLTKRCNVVGEDTGHYINLVNPDNATKYRNVVTGFGISVKNGRYTYIQTFSSSKNGSVYTVDDYEKAFDAYVLEVTTARDNLQAQLDSINTTIENLKRNGGISEADQAMINAAEERVESAQNRVNEYQKIYNDTTEALEALQLSRESAQTAYNNASQNEEAKKAVRETAEAEHQEALVLKNNAVELEEQARLNLESVTSTYNNSIVTSTITVVQPVTELSISHQTLTMQVGDSQTLSVTVKPDNASNKTLSWKSSNESVVKVDENGKVTALKEGKNIKITVTTTDGSNKSVTCTINVNPSYQLTLNEKQLNVIIGESNKLTYKITPNTSQTVVFTSSNDSVASVDSSGKVTAHKFGKVTIKVSLKNYPDIYDECSIRTLFSDVTDSSLFYYDYVYELADREIVAGWADGTFRPLNNCNRAAIMTFLWRLAGKPEPKKMATFKDMSGNAEFDKAISWGVENGITTGWADNTFRPWNTCNRAAIITFIWRYAGKPEPSKMATFTDMTSNTDFNKAISWAVENGITTGWADNTFRPWNNCNRLAAVSFLCRANKLN